MSRSVLSAVSHTVVRRPSGATAGLITVEFNYELSYITTESLIYIHPLAPLTRWYHAVCAQSAYRVHTAIVLSGNQDVWAQFGNLRARGFATQEAP